MAADGYLRSAITELNNAAIDMEQQVNQLHRGHADHHQRLEAEIKELQRLLGMESAEVAHSSGMGKSLAAEHMRHQQSDIDQKRAEISQVRAELDRTVQRKNDVIRALKDIAARLEVLAGSQDIR
jgi:chromosome segregation ATPase